MGRGVSVLKNKNLEVGMNCGQYECIPTLIRDFSSFHFIDLLGIWQCILVSVEVVLCKTEQ